MKTVCILINKRCNDVGVLLCYLDGQNHLQNSTTLIVILMYIKGVYVGKNTRIFTFLGIGVLEIIFCTQKIQKADFFLQRDLILFN